MATVVIVLCIAALVVVVVLGIYRIHVTHQQEVKLNETTKETDAAWDNSALSITVNPMEVGQGLWETLQHCIVCFKCVAFSILQGISIILDV